MYSEKTEHGHNHKTTLQIKQDDKFFNRLLSKEKDPSFRVTPVVAVPFLWESHPGTPKHPFFSGDHSLLPPLTPPPSYFYKNNNPTKKKISRSNLFRFSFPRFSLKKTLLLTSSFSSSQSSSSSSLDSSRTVGKRRRFSSCGSSVDLWGHSNFEVYEDNNNAGDVVVVRDSRRTPSSCFGFRRSSSFNGGFGSFYGRKA